MENIKEYIYESLISYHRNCEVDRYGQKGVISVSRVFRENTDMVLEYLKENRSNHKIFDVTTYGDRYSTFKGIFRIYDEDLNYQCNKVFREENKNYKRAMTTW
jgi:hypothetical protein